MVDYGGPDIRGRALNGKVSSPEVDLDALIANLKAETDDDVASPPRDALVDFDVLLEGLKAEQQPMTPGAAPVEAMPATTPPRPPGAAPSPSSATTEVTGAGLAIDRPEPFIPINPEAMQVINQIRKPAFEEAEKVERDQKIAELTKLPGFELKSRQLAARARRREDDSQLYAEVLRRKSEPVVEPERVYATPEEEPGAWARFTQSARNLTVGNATKALAVAPRIQKAIELESRFRMERGLYDPEEADDKALRESIARELELGLPMYSEGAARLQQEAYTFMSELGPKHFPAARGLWNKLAQAGGDLGTLVAELYVMRKAGLNKLAQRVAPPQMAGPLALGAGFAGSAALHGQDAKGVAEEFQTGMMLGGIGSAAGAITKTAPQTLAGVGVGGLFAHKAAKAGGDPWDIVIQGILVPLAFHGRGMSREVPRLLKRAPAKADQILGRAVEAVQAGRNAGPEVRQLVRGLTDGTLSLSKDGRKVWRNLRRPAPEEQRLAVEAGERTQPQREPSVFEPAVEARGEEAMREAGLTVVPELPKEIERAAKKGIEPEGRIGERPPVEGRGPAPEAGRGDRPREGGEVEAKGEGRPTVEKEVGEDALRIRPGEEAVRGVEEAGPPPSGGEPPGVERGKAEPPPAEKPPKEPAPVEILTRIPKEWRGRILFDWGPKGLRAQGNDYVRVKGERPRKTFDDLWLRDLDRIDVPNPKLVRAVKKMTDEVWPVRRRRGKYWSTSYYLAPKAMIERARESLAGPLPTKPAEEVKEDAAEAYDRKHKLMEATGFTPPRSAEAMGAVASPAETNTLYDTWGKITDYVRGSPERVRERELAKRIFRQRRGRVGLAAVDVHKMGKEFNRLEKEVVAPEELYNIHQAMVGRHPIDDLPEGQARWVRKARALHNKASLDLLGELLRVQGETALTESIRQNMETYLAETLTPKGPIERIKGLVSRRHKLRGEQFKFKRDKWAVQVGRSHFKFETKAEAQEAHDALLRNELTAVIKRKALERGVAAEDLKKAAAAKKVKLIAPLTEEQRIEMGFSRNPMFTWATSYVKTRHNAETLRVFRLLDKRFAQELPADVAIGDEKAIAEWAKESGLERIKGDKNVVGVLADKYLPRRIAKDVNELTKVPNLIERWYGAYLQAWKSSKTIWNPPTHMRNIFGNFMFTDLADNAVHDPRNLKFYKAAMADLLAKGSDYRLLVREGVIGGEYYGNEVKQILVRMEKGDAPDVALIKLVQLTHEKLGRLYNAEDQVFKLAAYLKYRSKGMAPKAAAREVNRWFPNYAELHPWTRKGARSPVGGPFLAFNEQAIRIVGRAMIRHPLKLAKWAAIPGAMTAFSTYYLGVDKDEKDLVDSRRSYFEPLLPVRDKDGAVQYLDLRYIVPMGNELQKFVDLGTGKSARIEVPFLFQSPPTSGWLDVSFNKKLFTGQRVVNPDDNLKTKIVKWSKHMLRESAPIPTSFTWGKERLQRAFSGESDEHVLTAVAGALFGVNIRDPYVSRQDAYDRIRALAEKDPAVKRVMDRLLNGKTRSISYRQLIRSLNRNDRFQDLLDIYNQAYRRSGGKEIKPKGVLQSIRGRAGEEAKKRKAVPISMAKPPKTSSFRPLPGDLSFEGLARTA